MPSKTKSSRPRLSTPLSRKIQMLQQRCADILNQKTRNWTRRKQKYFLFIVCMVMGGVCTLSLWGALSINYVDTQRSRPFTTVVPATRPPVTWRGIPKTASPADTLIFLRFRKALDSMLQTPEGRIAYRTFLQQHPGFPDSLANAEKLLKQAISH